jgi:hypothetical protein
MTNDKQQTGVEWLEQINNHCKKYGRTIEQKDIEQAKEMERERIENAWIAALDFGIEKMKGLNTLESKDAFEKFYKTTYGGNK